MLRHLMIGGVLAAGLGGGCATGSGMGATGGAGGAGAGAGTGGVGGLGVFDGGGGATAACKVVEATGNAVPLCTDKAPPESFAPVVQWTWQAPPAEVTENTAHGSTITPLVANLTDDNQDGAVDLCDTPDVLVVAFRRLDFDFTAQNPIPRAKGGLFLLAGDTGALELTFDGDVDGWVTPAIGDIDGDGVAEVVTADTEGRLVAYGNDGKIRWTGDPAGYRAATSSAHCAAVALYDLDGDGSVEILIGFEVFDAHGKRLWGVPGNATEFDQQYWCVTPTAADLDGDGTLEVLFGHATYRADGTELWKVNGPPAHPHVGNFDPDPEPEVVLTSMHGITLVQHDGSVTFKDMRPTDPQSAPQCWGKPGVIHDFDGDGSADFATGTCQDYSAYSIGSSPSPKWSASIQDISGLATATAFDFLGDGVPEAIYADEQLVYAFDGKSGNLALSAPRSSGTLIEYPVVADVDNDGAAEIVVVSNYFEGLGQAQGPTVTVLQDAESRWIPARRIWNQHSYHVTNVREDGVIPTHPSKSWLTLNTFRTNSQISGGAICDPPDPPK